MSRPSSRKAACAATLVLMSVLIVVVCVMIGVPEAFRVYVSFPIVALAVWRVDAWERTRER